MLHKTCLCFFWLIVLHLTSSKDLWKTAGFCIICLLTSTGCLVPGGGYIKSRGNQSLWAGTRKWGVKPMEWCTEEPYVIKTKVDSKTTGLALCQCCWWACSRACSSCVRWLNWTEDGRRFCAYCQFEAVSSNVELTRIQSFALGLCECFSGSQICKLNVQKAVVWSG